MIRPIGNRVLIKPIPNDSVIGGIHLPQDFQDPQPCSGVVLSIAERAKVKIPEVKQGDKVSFHRHDTIEVTYQDEKYVLVESENILVTID